MFTLVFTIMFKLIFIHVYKKKKSLLKDVLLRTHLCLLLLKSEYFCDNNTSGVLGTGLYCWKSAIILPEECGVIVPEEHRYIPIGARLYEIDCDFQDESNLACKFPLTPMGILTPVSVHA